MQEYLRDDDDELMPELQPGFSPGPTEVGGMMPEPTPRMGAEEDPTRIDIPRGDRFELDGGMGGTDATPTMPDAPSPVSAEGGLSTIFPGAADGGVAPLDLKSQRVQLPRRGFNPADTELDPYSESPQGGQESELIQAILMMLQGG